MDHPVLLWKPTPGEIKELRKKCIWMGIECCAWN